MARRLWVEQTSHYSTMKNSTEIYFFAFKQEHLKVVKVRK